ARPEGRSERSDSIIRPEQLHLFVLAAVQLARLLERATDPIDEPLRTLARPIGGSRMTRVGPACTIAHRESGEYPGEAQLAAIEKEHLQRPGRREHDSRGDALELRIQRHGPSGDRGGPSGDGVYAKSRLLRDRDYGFDEG